MPVACLCFAAQDVEQNLALSFLGLKILPQIAHGIAARTLFASTEHRKQQKRRPGSSGRNALPHCSQGRGPARSFARSIAAALLHAGLQYSASRRRLVGMAPLQCLQVRVALSGPRGNGPSPRASRSRAVR